MKALSPETLVVVSVLVACVPLLISVGTCYLKFSIVLGMLRSGFGTQQAPSNSLVLALSIVMSLAVMQPVAQQVEQRVSSMKWGELDSRPIGELMVKAREVVEPWYAFMLAHSGERELSVLASVMSREQKGVKQSSDGGGMTSPAVAQAGEARSQAQPQAGSPDGQISSESAAQPSLQTVLGAFVLSEIKRGFMTAFLLLLPFFVIDLVVANVLVGMGLTMVSPVIVSLPLKLLLFISTDGWLLLVKSMVSAYQ
jgi:type III secretory pathway component EscR